MTKNQKQGAPDFLTALGVAAIFILLILSGCKSAEVVNTSERERDAYHTRTDTSAHVTQALTDTRTESTKADSVASVVFVRDSVIIRDSVVIYVGESGNVLNRERYTTRDNYHDRNAEKTATTSETDKTATADWIYDALREYTAQADSARESLKTAKETTIKEKNGFFTRVRDYIGNIAIILAVAAFFVFAAKFIRKMQGK